MWWKYLLFNFKVSYKAVGEKNKAYVTTSAGDKICVTHAKLIPLFNFDTTRKNWSSEGINDSYLVWVLHRNTHSNNWCFRDEMSVAEVIIWYDLRSIVAV